jgi:hypothetical protein
MYLFHTFLISSGSITILPSSDDDDDDCIFLVIQGKTATQITTIDSFTKKVGKEKIKITKIKNKFTF